MNLLFMYFTADGNPDHAALRIDGKKVPDTDLWELWDMYELLMALGARPIKSTTPTGYILHMIQY